MKNFKDESIRESMKDGLSNLKDIGTFGVCTGIIIVGDAIGIPTAATKATYNLVVKPTLIVGSRAVDKVGSKIGDVKNNIHVKKEKKSEEEPIIMDNVVWIADPV